MEEILKDPPKDHNDHYGNRMVSHEREMTEPPYVRKERLAPFRASEEYDRSRAEVLRLEAQGREALASGDKEKAATLLMEMSRKSEQLGRYTQRWDAIDDYARCCDLPTMIKLYYTTGNLTGISPFIDTDNMFPELLKQCRIEWDVCGIPVLIFAGAAGFRPCFAISSIFCYGLKRLDCLDLMMLMTDSDFLSDVCRACNEEDEAPRVFPADRTVCAGQAGKEQCSSQ